MTDAACPGCGGPLEQATAGFTEKGLVCQRCVLAEQRADAQQMQDNVASGRDLGRSRPRSATGLAIAGAVWAAKEAKREDIWASDDLLFIPSFGSGLSVVHLTDSELVVGEIERDDCTKEKLGGLADLADWGSLASKTTRYPWEQLTEVRMHVGRFSLSAGDRRESFSPNDAERFKGRLEQRLSSWAWVQEPLSLGEILGGSGCLMAIGSAIAGLLYFGLAFLASALDWDTPLEGSVTLDEAIWVTVFRWLVQYGPTCVLVLGGLFVGVLFLNMIKDLRKRPMIDFLRPPTS